MLKYLTEEQNKILVKLGFTEYPDSEDCHAFKNGTRALNTKMLVNGDHATDCAYIYYGRETTSEGETLEGLFYSPSLLEHLLVFHHTEWDCEGMISDINKNFGCEARLVMISIYPMIYLEAGKYEWESELQYPLSDMLQIVGALNYLLTMKNNELSGIE